MNHNIELIRYRRYGEELLLFELINATSVGPVTNAALHGTPSVGKYKTIGEVLSETDQQLRDRFESIKDFMLALGDDVQMKELRYYFAFKRIKNFACVELRPQKGIVLVYVKVNPDEVDLVSTGNLLRDVRAVGHFGTGDLEITIRNVNDFELAKSLLERSYESS
jgi:predicted transport protein